jgi:hypothetical protein
MQQPTLAPPTSAPPSVHGSTTAPTPASAPPAAPSENQVWVYLFTNPVCGGTPIALNMFSDASSSCVSVPSVSPVPDAPRGGTLPQLQPYSVTLSREHSTSRAFRLAVFAGANCSGTAQTFDVLLRAPSDLNATCVTVPMATTIGQSQSTANVSWLIDAHNDVNMTRQLCSTYGGQNGVVRNCTAGGSCLATTVNTTAIAGYQAAASAAPLNQPGAMVIYYFGWNESGCTSHSAYAEDIYTVANGSCIPYPETNFSGGVIPAFSHRVYRLHPTAHGFRVVRYHQSTNCSGPDVVTAGLFGTCGTINMRIVNVSTGLPTTMPAPFAAYLTPQSIEVPAGRVRNYTGSGWAPSSASTLAPTPAPTPPAAPSASGPVYVYSFKSVCGTDADTEILYTIANDSCIVYPRQNFTAGGGYVRASSGRVLRHHPASRGFRITQYLQSTNCTGPATVSQGNFGTSCSSMNFTSVNTTRNAVAQFAVPFEAYTTAQPALAAEILPSRIYTYTGSGWINPNPTAAPTVHHGNSTTVSPSQSSTASPTGPVSPASHQAKHHPSFNHTTVIAAAMGCILTLLAVVLTVWWVKRVKRAATAESYLALTDLADNPTFNDDKMTMSRTSYLDDDDGDAALMVMEPNESQFSDTRDVDTVNQVPYEDDHGLFELEYEDEADDNSIVGGL